MELPHAMNSPFQNRSSRELLSSGFPDAVGLNAGIDDGVPTGDRGSPAKNK